MDAATRTLLDLARSGGFLATDVGEVRALFRRAADAPPGQPGDDPIARTLGRLIGGYRGTGPDAALWVGTGAVHPELAGPVLGDPALAPWPFSDPLSLSDDRAVEWLAALAHCTAATPDIRRFVRILFCTIPRRTWRPAAATLARLALIDDELRQDIEALRNGCRESAMGDPMTAKPVVVSGPLPVEYRRHGATSHLPRHGYVTICELLATGLAGSLNESPLFGLELGRIDDLDTDLSACFAGWQALLRSPDRAIRERARLAVEDVLQRDLARAAEQVDNILREVADTLLATGSSKTAELVVDFLCAPRWRGVPAAQRSDRLWSWTRTARWCHGHHMTERLQAMRAAAGPAEEILRFGLDPPSPANLPAALLPPLHILADADTWSTTDEESRVLAVVMADTLAGPVREARLPWASLLRRAGVTGDVPVPVRESSDPSVGVALLAAHRNTRTSSLLRDVTLDESTAVHLARLPGGFFAKQAAVQLDRLLRSQPVGNHRIRLLWSALATSGEKEFLKQLESRLWGADSAVHRLVRALRALWADRESTVANRMPDLIQDLETALAEVAGDQTNLQNGDTRRPSLGPVADGIRTLERSGGSCCTQSWLDAIASVLARSRNDADGFVAWVCWLEGRTRVDHPCHAALDQLSEVVKDALAHRRTVHAGQLSTVVSAIAALRRALPEGRWPERVITAALIQHLDRCETWLSERLATSHSKNSCIRALLDAHDEAGLIEELDLSNTQNSREDILLLPRSTIRAAHQFLIDCLQFRFAGQLRSFVAPEVVLVGNWQSRAPLLAGAAAGIWLVLDVASGWTSLLPRPIPLWSTVAVCHAASLALLALSVFNRVQFQWQRFWRTLLLYGQALFANAASTAIVIRLLAGTSAIDEAWGRQFFLFNGLGMFLGIFIGILLQGRGLIERE